MVTLQASLATLSFHPPANATNNNNNKWVAAAAAAATRSSLSVCEKIRWRQATASVLKDNS